MEDKFTFTISIKKRTVLIVVSAVLVFALLLLGGVLFLKSNENGTVIIRGKVVTDIPIKLDPPEQTVLMPFVAVLRELDYKINQQDENVIIISDGDQKFELNLEELTLYEEGSNFNYLESPPGFHYYWCYRKESDIELDAITFASALALMDSEYKMVDVPKLKAVFIY